MIWPLSHFARRAAAHQAPAPVAEVTVTVTSPDPAQVARMAEVMAAQGEVSPARVQEGVVVDASRRVFGGLT